MWVVGDGKGKDVSRDELNKTKTQRKEPRLIFSLFSNNTQVCRCYRHQKVAQTHT